MSFLFYLHCKHNTAAVDAAPADDDDDVVIDDDDDCANSLAAASEGKFSIASRQY